MPLIQAGAWGLASNWHSPLKGMQSFQHAAPTPIPKVFVVIELRCNVYIPIRKCPAQRIKPFRQPCFTRIDFLTSADQANHNRPILMAIHSADQKLRFSVRERGYPLLGAMNFSIISCVHARCASSKMAIRSGGMLSFPTKESRYL